MKHGFVKVAAATPEIRVADTQYNADSICRAIEEAAFERAKVIVFPELCITGCTCQDLFLHEVLLKGAKDALRKIADFTSDKDILVFVGLPLCVEGKVYDVAAALNKGNILGFITKSFLKGKSGLSQIRQFAPGPESVKEILFDGDLIPFGPQICFQDVTMEELIVSAEIGEDLLAPVPPSTLAAADGAVIIANCAAFHEVVGMDQYRRDMIKTHSARTITGYVMANAGDGESTTDLVFAGRNTIAENGEVLKETNRFSNEIVYNEIDIQRIAHERRSNTNCIDDENKDRVVVPFYVEKEETDLTRTFYMFPFVPEGVKERSVRAEEILMIQAAGLKKRLAHTHAKQVVVGISGGLDSTLALLVTARAFDLLGLDRKGIMAVTMPCFGTTDRTYQNACEMAERLGTTLREVKIADAVKVHLRDIGHELDNLNVTYENAQARERTQVLMDLANEVGGMVIGTGDLSELALGWATYNGDHMSMYGVNASIPKTLVRHLVRYEADQMDDRTLAKVLYDVLDTPVSPELLPPKDGDIAQITEDLVGPYELHDFFLYYMLRYGYTPSKIFRIAEISFADKYDNVTILKWLETFSRRFFTQQFKRSCLPDGPKVGTVGISPRGDLLMASDSCSTLWMKDLEQIRLM